MNVKTIIALAVVILGLMAPFLAWAGGAKTVWVDSYTKKDGTYVSGHWRSPPDGTGSGAGGVAAAGSGYSAYYGSGLSSPGTSDWHFYSVRVYEGGDLVAYGHGNDKSSETSAEVAVWAAQEKLRSSLYKRGLGHLAVDRFISETFSPESCRLTTGPVKVEPNRCCDWGTNIHHTYEMNCLTPSPHQTDAAVAFTAPGRSPEPTPTSAKTTKLIRFPLTCKAEVDATASSFLCVSDGGKYKFSHSGSESLQQAELFGYVLTVYKDGAGQLVAEDILKRRAPVILGEGQ